MPGSSRSSMVDPLAVSRAPRTRGVPARKGIGGSSQWSAESPAGERSVLAILLLVGELREEALHDRPDAPQFVTVHPGEPGQHLAAAGGKA